MTAAATLSTTWRRAGPRTPAVGQAALGRHRREPLVVGLDRHPDDGSQPLPPPDGQPGRPGPSPPERLSGSPTTTHSASSAARARRAGVVVRRDPAPLDHGQRRRDRAGPVADRDADPLRAEVEPERPHRSGTRRAAASSTSSRDAQRLVDAARGSCRPRSPRHPCLRRPRRRPGRVTDEVGGVEPEPGLRRSDELTPPVVDSPISTTTSMPSTLRTARASSRSSLGASPSTRATTTPSSAVGGQLARPPGRQLGAQGLHLVGAAPGPRRAGAGPRRPARRPVTPTSWAASASTRSSRWSRATLPSPVTASMRRRFEPIEPSLTILIVPMSPVARTWVPPQSSSEEPASSTRTMSPYLSPKKAIAPIASASSFVVSNARTGVLARVSLVDDALDLARSRRRSAGRSGRSRTAAGPGATSEPACLTCSPSTWPAGRSGAGGCRCGCAGSRSRRGHRSRPSAR